MTSNICLTILSCCCDSASEPKCVLTANTCINQPVYIDMFTLIVFYIFIYLLYTQCTQGKELQIFCLK